MSGRLALLWHLHQPDYREPDTGRPMMPWVRLHGLRGYRDLWVEGAERGVPMTVNVVPSLLDQLLWYAEGGDDRHLELTRRPADTLSGREIDEVLGTLPAGHPAMTDAHPAWAELRRRIEAGERLPLGAVRDVQVWSTLCWFGATAHRDLPELAALEARGRGFTEDDKAVLLAAHDRLIADLPARLRAFAQADGPCLSTSPYFHPILPLLVDARHARRCMPDLPDEVDFAYPQDALRQLVSARERVEALCGRAPVGLWPSEGSVSPEVVALAGRAGFRWLCTDQGVLARSEREPASRPGGWDLGHGVTGFFRDTELSDRVGFRYADADPEQAARDLVGTARERAGGGVLLVALDGENPWESFRDAGGAFRDALYRQLAEGPVRAVSLDEAAAEPPVGRVTRLHTGSWIGADFRIWIGHPEDRAAWRQLAAARQAAEAAPPEAREAAMTHLLAAEGSDWTWWYGEDFRTPWAATFDALFRAHLRAAWRALGQPAPAALDQPISRPFAPERLPPERWLPLCWDEAAGWLGWAGAGQLQGFGGAMAKGAAVHRVRYGWSRAPDGAPEALWVRVEARGEGWAPLRTDGWERRELEGAVVLRRAGGDAVALQLATPGGERWPDEPVLLAPPERPDLGWWQV